MRHQRRLPGLVLALTAATIVPVVPLPATAEPPRAADIKSQVSRLIGDLGAATRAEREAAEKSLLKLGSPVLEHLPAPELLPSASVRAAVDRVRHELERVKARESVQPSRVNLEGRRTLEEWLAEIEHQTGNPIDAKELPQRIRERSLDLTLVKRDFWPALDGISRQSNVKYDFDDTRRRLKFRSADPVAPPHPDAVGYAGAFRLVAAPAEIRQGPPREPQREESAAPAIQLVRISLAVQAEPRLRPLFLHYSAADVQAWLGAGRRLEPFSPEASYEAAVGEGAAQSRLQLDYVLPKAPAGDTLRLQGTLRLTLAAASDEIRFRDLTRAADDRPLGIARRRGGLTVTLLRVRSARQATAKRELRVQTIVAYDSGGPAFESHRTWMLHNEVYLDDAQGRRVPLNGGIDTTLQADGGAGLEYRFTGLPDPLPDYAFVYVAPTLIVDAPIKFEIESVPVR